MARYQFPHDRTAFLIPKDAFQPVLVPPRTTMQIYADANASVLADIRNLDGTLVNSSTLYVENAIVPEFLGPDGTIRVWGKIAGSSVANAIYAQLVIGTTTGGTTYTHTQTLAQSVWNVAHNLGRFPAAVGLFSADFTMQWDEFAIRHVDMNNMLISMDTPTPGVAVIE